MKDVTISIDEQIYRRARKKAAVEDTSLSRVVESLLGKWAEQDDRVSQLARLDRLFEEADSRDSEKQGCAGPFSREELYSDYDRVRVENAFRDIAVC